MATLENARVSVVMLGGFDPAACLPEKLGEKNVVRDEEARAARIVALIPNQFVSYALDWCDILVTRDRFSIDAKTPPFVRVSDLMQKAISELMPKAWTTKFGINRQYSIKFASVAERNLFGIRISPPSNWGEWGARIQKGIEDSKGSEVHGGVMSVLMREIPVQGRDRGWRDVSILGSGSVLPDGSVLAADTITLNDHFEIDDSKIPAELDAEEARQRRSHVLMRTLSDSFDKSIDALERIAEQIMK